jgi:hypothetical protein
MNILKKSLIHTLVVASVMAGIPVFSQAAMVSNDTLVQESSANDSTGSDSKTRLRNLLARGEVQSELRKRGVNPAEALGRVNALTDDEATQLAQTMDTAPAGGDILGLAFTVFIILLVTDILGLTKVFPFTRAIR